MRFTKVQGAGNDFVLLEVNADQRDWPQLAQDMCDRHYGIGADGLLLLMPSESADLQMRIFNADGSEADACGNGLRCMVKYYIDHGLTIPETRELFIETRTGNRRAEIVKQDGKITKIKISMGEPRFSSDDIPVVIVTDEERLVDIKSILAYPIIIDGRELELNLVSVGNPHAVHFTQDPIEDFPLSQIGPKIELHRIFPKGVNFEIAKVVNSQYVNARVWERGVGETLACGTGACAISATGQKRGYLDPEVDIKLPGGTLGVQWDGSGEIFLSGPTGIVFSGEWPD